MGGGRMVVVVVMVVVVAVVMVEGADGTAEDSSKSQFLLSVCRYRYIVRHYLSSSPSYLSPHSDRTVYPIHSLHARSASLSLVKQARVAVSRNNAGRSVWHVSRQSQELFPWCSQCNLDEIGTSSCPLFVIV